jgi:hypothetical protein
MGFAGEKTDSKVYPLRGIDLFYPNQKQRTTARRTI